jgi:hypothetical protein
MESEEGVGDVSVEGGDKGSDMRYFFLINISWDKQGAGD